MTFDFSFDFLQNALRDHFEIACDIIGPNGPQGGGYLSAIARRLEGEHPDALVQVLEAETLQAKGLLIQDEPLARSLFAVSFRYRYEPAPHERAAETEIAECRGYPSTLWEWATHGKTRQYMDRDDAFRLPSSRLVYPLSLTPTCFAVDCENARGLQITWPAIGAAELSNNYWFTEGERGGHPRSEIEAVLDRAGKDFEKSANGINEFARRCNPDNPQLVYGVFKGEKALLGNSAEGLNLKLATRFVLLGLGN